MKVSLHAGRHKTLKHNQHEFNSEHINKNLSKNNIYYLASNSAKTCEECAYQIYKELYSEAVEKQNEKYRKKGQYSRLRTTDDWVKAPRYLPHEEILQIGDMENHASIKDLNDCIQDYISWKQETFGSNMIPISVAIHVDEATPHAHEVDAFFYTDADGTRKPGVAKALEQLEIPLPDPSKPIDKENNRLMVYTEICRRKWQKIVMSYGYEIDVVPDPARKHKSTEQYKADEQARKALEASEEALAKKYALEQQNWQKRANLKLKMQEKQLRKQLEDEYEKKYQDELKKLQQQESANQKAIALGRQIQAENMPENIEKPQRELPTLSFPV